MASKTHTQHPDDILIVRNTNVDDPDHKEYFEVTWDRIPFRIQPGSTRRMPRYLAYHYSKHLINRIIERMDMAQFGRKMKISRLRDQKLRDSLQREILIAVDQYFMADDMNPQAQLMRLYGELNPDDAQGSANLGTVEIPLEPPTLESLKKDEAGNPILKDIKPIADDKDGIGKKESDKVPTMRSKEELLAEAEELGLELTGKESAEDIQKAILSSFSVE